MSAFHAAPSSIPHGASFPTGESLLEALLYASFPIDCVALLTPTPKSPIPIEKSP